MTTTPQTITLTDQNTRRPVVWIVDLVMDEDGTETATENGWTHSMAIHRPNGRRSFVVFVRMNDAGEIIRHSTPRKAF